MRLALKPLAVLHAPSRKFNPTREPAPLAYGDFSLAELGPLAILRSSDGKHASDKPEERQMNGIQFYKFGEALKAKELGYKLTEIIVSTESEISRKYQNQDAVAVPSATTLDGKTEYGIFKK